MSWVGILPYAYEPYFQECVKTMHPDFRNNVIAVDDTNPETRQGIMKIHNQGVGELKKQDADWLVIISAAIRFGEAGGLDFIDQLESHDDHYVIHAASQNVKGGKQQSGGGGKNAVFGWHLTAFNQAVFENVGRWDENFTPYSLDDIDLSIRIQKHYQGQPGWETYPCDVSDTTMSHSINLGGVKATYPPRNSYFKRKWGRDGGAWDVPTYDHPFNDSTKPLSYWPQPDDPLSIDRIEFSNGRDY